VTPHLAWLTIETLHGSLSVIAENRTSRFGGVVANGCTC
jgi:hypothetical protein